jgi:hypothetical protein
MEPKLWERRSDMITCKTCLSEMDDDDNFCGECGSKLEPPVKAEKRKTEFPILPQPEFHRVKKVRESEDLEEVKTLTDSGAWYVLNKVTTSDEKTSYSLGRIV